ncbi:thermonuclease family protein [Pleomorphomonas koreensis]|uniref:thermonuclease family protein n=1 Tax=Pleomorphomonas koreensis TaxID=257440 RepID=UPI00041F837B|nr:thermonuclease family protein [Pleomorphomonas koreensis]
MATFFTVIVCAAVCAAAPLRVVDGDTVVLRTETLRLLHIDAPETFHPRCPAELERGLKAKAALERILTGARITVERHGTDRYRRTLARIGTDAGDVGDMMLKSGHAVRYEPGRQAYEERERTWCGN